MAQKQPQVVKHLWLVRHGEAMHNVKDVTNVAACDVVNARLTERGRKQAAQLSGPVDLLILSPMRRAIETYAHSNLKVARVMMSDLVREWRVYGPSCDLDLEPPPGAGGESETELRKRVAQTVELMRQQPETNITILSHGVFLAELAKHVGRPLKTNLGNAHIASLKFLTI